MYQPITAQNSIVVDSEWWVNDTSPHPCLISYKSATLPATVTNGTTPMPDGYAYYVSWYVGAERNKIPLPDGGQWVCLASLAHSIYFDCIVKAESLAGIYQRVCGKSLDKNARDRFVKEKHFFTDYSMYLSGVEGTDLVKSEIRYSRKDAEVTWEVFAALLPDIAKMQPEKLVSIIAHSNMYTYSHPNVQNWIAEQNQQFEGIEAGFTLDVERLVEAATPDNSPALDWELMPQKKIPKWKNKNITVRSDDFGFLLGVTDAQGVPLVPRKKDQGGWINGNCMLFCKDMIPLWENGDIKAVNPGADKILKSIIRMFFWSGIRGNLEQTYRWNTGTKVFQDQTPSAAMTGRSTSKTCLLFPKDITKDKLGFEVRMLYHHMPKGVYQVGFDFSAQEALILALICKSLGDDRLYKSATADRIHDDNAALWKVSRADAKAGFYASVYGASPKRLQQTLGMDLESATAIVEGIYGRGGICERYLNYLKRNQKRPTSIFYRRPATVVHTSVHLLKDWMVQSCGNDQLHYVVSKLALEGHQLSQTVHDELWFFGYSDRPDPWNEPSIVALGQRMNQLYQECFTVLCDRLNLPYSDVDLPCFQAEVEITNRGLKYFRDQDGVLREPCTLANSATDRVAGLGKSVKFADKLQWY
jgi:DNA polymerase family A